MPKKPTKSKTAGQTGTEAEDAEVVADENSAPAAETEAADAAKPAGSSKKKDAPEAGEVVDEAGRLAEEAAEEILEKAAADELAPDLPEPDLPEPDLSEPDTPDLPETEEFAEPDHADDYHDDHDRRGTVASRVLTGLVVFLVGAAIALWAAPRVAPHLPVGLARHLETGSTVSEDDLTRMRTAFDGRMRALEAKTLGVATVTELVDTRLGETRATIEARIGALADQIAAADSAAIESRLSEVETTLAGLESRFESLSAGLTDISTGGAGLSQEDAARIAGFAAAVEGLRGEIASLSNKSGALSQRIDEVAAAADRRVEEAEVAAETVKTEAATAIQSMALTTALEELEIAVGSGAPYASELAKLAEAAAAPPPDALAAAAETGAPDIDALQVQLTAAAHEAIAASTTADAGPGFVGQASAWFRAQFTGLPVEETAGDSVPAILSRVSARLDEGDVDAALAEAATLPPVAADALAAWKASAERRRDALAGLAAYRAALGGAG